MKMQEEIIKALKIAAGVVLVVFALMILFAMMTGCTTFQEAKHFDIDCKAECKKCEDLKLDCSTDFHHHADSEDSSGIIEAIK